MCGSVGLLYLQRGGGFAVEYNFKDHEEILDFYNSGAEIKRLQTGIGKLEFERSKEIISRYLGGSNQNSVNNMLIIYDIGGGTGEYARWLAGMGHEVHLLELSPKAIDYARELNKNLERPIAQMQVANALSLELPDESADMVLLMGPLYHLTERSDRIKALKEAGRVLKEGGILITSAISRYGSTLWGLSVFGQKNHFIDDEIFFEMIDRELTNGQHVRPEKYPGFIARSFFHLPGELKEEIQDAGFIHENMITVEGPVWIVPLFEEKWENTGSRNRLLDICKKVEAHENIMGMSPHILGIARK